MARMAQDVDLGRLVPIAERVATEGEPYGPSLMAENFTATDGYFIGNLNLASLSRAWYVESLTFSSNKLAMLQVLLGFNPTQSNLQEVYRVIVSPGQPAVIPVRNIFRPHQALTPYTLTPIGAVTARRVLDATPAGSYMGVSSAGFSIYDDLNFSADKIMLVIGDSILNGTSGLTQKSKSMEWLTRGYFQARGSNLRVINKSISGSTTSDHEARRASGVYDFPQVDYIHYQLGTNDASVISAATAQANLAAMIAYKQRRYPKATMIVWGSTPRENNTAETALSAIRSAQQAAVTSAADPKVLFCSLASAFDRTNVANFSSADTTGDHVHPVDSAHAAAYGLISGFLTAQNITL